MFKFVFYVMLFTLRACHFDPPGEINKVLQSYLILSTLYFMHHKKIRFRFLLLFECFTYFPSCYLSEFFLIKVFLLTLSIYLNIYIYIYIYIYIIFYYKGLFANSIYMYHIFFTERSEMISNIHNINSPL